jgi:hypothetical protein
MKIDFQVVKENEDGSADCTIDMDKDAMQVLINFGFVTMLSKSIEEGKLYTPEYADKEKKDNKLVPMNEDQINDIVVDSLKDTFEMQFKSLSDHRDDIVFQHKVKEACKVLLSYYMIPSEAAGYIEDVEESNGDF